MIVRSWTARATPENAERYMHHFRDAVAPALDALAGFLGASVLQRTDTSSGEPRIEIVVLTRWQTMDAVRAFAGDRVDAAVIEPAAAAVLEHYDHEVIHYSVAYDG
jgi:heme-degrading monooxygenase HmoA